MEGRQDGPSPRGYRRAEGETVGQEGDLGAPQPRPSWLQVEQGCRGGQACPGAAGWAGVKGGCSPRGCTPLASAPGPPASRGLLTGSSHVNQEDGGVVTRQQEKRPVGRKQGGFEHLL